MQLPPSLTDPRFTFSPDEHRYTFDGRPLANATSALKRWVRPFPARKVAERVAAREGRDPAEILRSWDQARDTAAELGTAVHAAIEADLNGAELPALSPEAERRFRLYEQFRDTRLAGATFLAPELRVYSLRLGLAGTIDLLAELADGRVVIFDFKTSKRFRFGPEGYNPLLPPFSDLTENEGSKFALQLAIYRLMLADHDIQTDGCYIVWLGPDTDRTIVYEPLDLREDVERALTAKPDPKLAGKILIPNRVLNASGRPPRLTSGSKGA